MILQRIFCKKIFQSAIVGSILIPRCEYMPITAIGALKTGYVYQPLDSTYLPERLNFIIKDASAKILITTKELEI